MTMKLRHLLRALGQAEAQAPGDPQIRGLALDSRQVGPSFLFAVVPGPRADGTRYVPDAVAKGAVAVVASGPVAVPPHVALVRVPEVRPALADLSRRFYGCPADGLEIVGVTGTNGKTTVASLVRALLATAGRQAALLSTVVRQIGSLRWPAPNTTPEAPELHRCFAAARERGIGHAVMEVSSQALDQQRVRGVPFAIAAWTNLTPNEHCDYHGTLEAYRDAKARLFDSLAPQATAVLNADDPQCGFFLSRARRAGACTMTYALSRRADVCGAIEETDLAGMTLRLETPLGRRRVRSPLVGHYNASNVLAATCCALALGMDLETIVTGLERFPGAPGRLERVSNGQAFTVLVDYAHNEAGLRSVLQTLGPLTPGRLIVVFGAGGDRDASKRPLMGRVACQCADLAIVTADNSRGERTEAIIAQIVAGMPDPRKSCIEPERREAIRRAIREARPGDLVLIAGKGHETYQELAGVRYPFDDRHEARKALEGLAGREGPA